MKRRDPKRPLEGKKKKAEEAFNQPFVALKTLKAEMVEAEKAAAAKPGARKVPTKAPPPAAPAKSDPADEAMTFHRLMSGVVPLDQDKSRIPKSQSPVPRSPAADQAARRANAKSEREAEEAQVHDHLRALVEGRARFEVTDDGRRVEGRRVDLPPDLLRKLRRGIMPIDARLDLHGQRAGSARETVEAFLREKRARGERCVLVVHGKGDHSPNGVGILRGEIAAWLAQSAASEHVAAFATATEDDGGEGAVYILLRTRG